MQRVKEGAARGASPQQPGLAVPERLVGLGFRYWLTGFRSGDISCWEKAWCAYSNALGAFIDVLDRHTLADMAAGQPAEPAAPRRKPASAAGSAAIVGPRFRRSLHDHR